MKTLPLLFAGLLANAAVPPGAANRVIRIQPGAYFGRTVLNKARVTLRGSGPDTLLTCNLGQAMPGEDGRPMGWQGAAALRITDSRSFLSYTRHEYFRRVLCNLLGAEMDRGELPADRQLVGSMVANICFANACDHFRLELDPAWDAWSRRVEAP